MWPFDKLAPLQKLEKGITPAGEAMTTPTPAVAAAKEAKQDQVVKNLWNGLPPKNVGEPVQTENFA